MNLPFSQYRLIYPSNSLLKKEEKQTCLDKEILSFGCLFVLHRAVSFCLTKYIITKHVF